MKTFKVLYVIAIVGRITTHGILRDLIKAKHKKRKIHSFEKYLVI